MDGDALQHIDQAGVDIDALQLAGHDPAQDDRGLFGAEFRPAESSQPRGVSPLSCSQNRT